MNRTVRLSNLALVAIICFMASRARCQDFEQLCNGCPCITNCRAGCGVVAYEYKTNKWCQRCGCTEHDLRESEREREREQEREREKALCPDGCPCMGVCPHKCGVVLYDYKNRQCQKCGCTSPQEALEREREMGRERLERERERLEKEKEREREKLKQKLCDGCPCMVSRCSAECGILSYEYKKGKWCQKVI